VQAGWQGAPSVSDQLFSDHFAKLFGKESAEQLLHLTPERVGRVKAETRTELAGLPTVAEVRRAIAGLNSGRAPGSNGL
jgi:hypothetical protein